jgi:hypothetical protein
MNNVVEMSKRELNSEESPALSLYFTQKNAVFLKVESSIGLQSSSVQDSRKSLVSLLEIIFIESLEEKSQIQLFFMNPQPWYIKNGFASLI